MNYIIRNRFGPGSEGWTEYSEWAGLEDCEEYYSIDGIMRKGLFSPETGEDWENCVNEDFKTHIITNVEYANKVAERLPNAEAIGIIEDPISAEEAVPSHHELVGYDILDGDGHISLVTNWGGRKENEKIKKNRFALISQIKDAYDCKNDLRSEYPEDPHAADCEVWAIYRIDKR
jgi:hypothetical protein